MNQPTRTEPQAINLDAAATTSDVSRSITSSADTIASLGKHAEQIANICRTIVASLQSGNKLMTAGHGGSAAEALHMAEELVGRFNLDRRPLPAIALTADPTLLTCIANDYGFASIFPRQVEAHTAEGDILVIFSTSGNGEGLLKAAEIAQQKSATVIGFLGKGGGQIATRCDHALIVDSNETARIQEAHQLIMHIVLEAVDRAFA